MPKLLVTYGTSSMMYGIDNIRVLEGPVGLGIRVILALGCKRNGLCFFVQVE